MIELQNFTKYYGKTLAAENISFKVEDGHIACLLGRNGAGKTTILKAVCGIHYPSSGTVLVNGIDAVKDPVKIKKITGYAPENPVFLMNYTVKEFLNTAVNLRCLQMQTKDKKSRVCELMEKFSLQDVRAKKISELSKGFKQRTVLAGALAADPAVLVLDEPTSGLDPVQVQEKRDFLKQLSKTRTIIISTHSMSEAEALCSDVFVINGGHLVASGTAESLKAENSASSLEDAFLKIINKEKAEQ